MTPYILKKEQLVRRPLKEVFAFFENPENIGAVTPPSLGLVLLTPAPIFMKVGILVDYSVRILVFRLRWTSLITLYDPPLLFVDEQLRGPFSYWRHIHSFRETPEGTMISDEVRYLIPFGFLGRWAHSVFVGRRLEAIFSHRARTIAKIFGQEGDKP